jgi:uncharacterized damage-inducible protein DinB
MMTGTVPQLRRLFEWDRWANRDTLDSLASVAAPPAPSLKIMAHIVAVQELWRARLMGESTAAIVVWPDWPLEEVEWRMNELARDWTAYLSDLYAGMLKECVAYTNSKSERWENAIGDVLMQVIMHGVYHRGQIASGIRAAGGEPAYTDFIEAVRKGFVK